MNESRIYTLIPGNFIPQFASFRANLLDTTLRRRPIRKFHSAALGLYWVFKADRHEPYNIFIMVFLSIGIVPLFFSDWVLQTRVLYNIPFQIPYIEEAVSY